MGMHGFDGMNESLRAILAQGKPKRGPVMKALGFAWACVRFPFVQVYRCTANGLAIALVMASAAYCLGHHHGADRYRFAMIMNQLGHAWTQGLLKGSNESIKMLIEDNRRHRERISELEFERDAFKAELEEKAP